MPDPWNNPIDDYVPPENQRPFKYNPPDVPLDVVYEDDAVLVLNKPYGLLSVQGKPLHHKDCLEFRVKDAYPEATAVHRLDHSTSGLILFAGTEALKSLISRQFQERTVKKVYRARVWGEVTEEEGVIDVPLRKNWEDSPRQMVCYERGKRAVTRWKVLERGGGATLLELYPETGRTHQLRLHTLHIGHPILGDELYAPDPAYEAAPRLLLHATELSFEHPETGETVSFRSEPDF
ncbi:RluA family pseudouridine synthase [Ponticaulis koreensis]|uniref:RluA family pseudouridine synthase n=1 Tax=Ponticaulis koreensis TaxID=1123045 RepID=UPI0003B67BBB|nr:RluA family pseudouridine synthase [Ponticaulis koreensis]